MRPWCSSHSSTYPRTSRSSWGRRSTTSRKRLMRLSTRSSSLIPPRRWCSERYSSWGSSSSKQLRLFSHSSKWWCSGEPMPIWGRGWLSNSSISLNKIAHGRCTLIMMSAICRPIARSTCIIRGARAGRLQYLTLIHLIKWRKEKHFNLTRCHLIWEWIKEHDQGREGAGRTWREASAQSPPSSRINSKATISAPFSSGMINPSGPADRNPRCLLGFLRFLKETDLSSSNSMISLRQRSKPSKRWAILLFLQGCKMIIHAPASNLTGIKTNPLRILHSPRSSSSLAQQAAPQGSWRSSNKSSRLSLLPSVSRSLRHLLKTQSPQTSPPHTPSQRGTSSKWPLWIRKSSNGSKSKCRTLKTTSSSWTWSETSSRTSSTRSPRTPRPLYRSAGGRTWRGSSAYSTKI